VVMGYPGTGKFTVANELVSELAAGGTTIRLVDNHAAANIVFDLIAEADGKTPLPIGVLDRVRDINLVIARTIDEHSPPAWSFVLTHHLLDNAQDRAYLGRLETLARQRGSTFLLVVLTCDQDVLLDRVAEPERRSRNKLVDRSIALTIIERGMLTPSRAMTIDVTHRTPTETAKMIRSRLVQEFPK
jgi:AAA domain